MSGSDCCFLICIQISQETDKVVWYPHLFTSFPQFVVIHIVKGFSTINEKEVDVFLEYPCFLYDTANVGNLLSGSSAFSKPSLDIWKFLLHVMLKPSMQDFKHDVTTTGDECKCPKVWTFFSTALVFTSYFTEIWFPETSRSETSISKVIGVFLKVFFWYLSLLFVASFSENKVNSTQFSSVDIFWESLLK